MGAASDSSSDGTPRIDPARGTIEMKIPVEDHSPGATLHGRAESPAAPVLARKRTTDAGAAA